MTDDNELELRQGIRRLKALLPRARADASREDTKLEAYSDQALEAIPYISEKNLQALLIYQVPGGWSADIVLRRVPAGVLKTFGTPVASPLPTREAAETAAYDLLVTVLAYKRKEDDTQAIPSVFRLYDAQITLEPEAFKTIIASEPSARTGYGSVAAAAKRLDYFMNELMPNAFNQEAFERLSKDAKCRVFAIVHMAALSGLRSYPQPILVRPA